MNETQVTPSQPIAVRDRAPATSGVYSIVNTTNGRRYYGSTRNLDLRQRTHWSYLRSGNHANRHLQNSWNKYGEFAFVFMVIELVGESSLLVVEQKYINSNRNGYNIAVTAGSRLGVKASEETRRRMSDARRKMPPPSLQTRQLWSRQRKGRKPSADVRSKMSEGLTKHWASKKIGSVTLDCELCGEAFAVPYGQRKRRSTCSRKCAGRLISKSKKASPSWNRIIHDGLSLTAPQWAERIGIPFQTIQCRIRKGWEISRVLSVGYKRKMGGIAPQRLCHDGRTQLISEWAKEMGVSHQVINQRLKKGWTVTEAITTPIASRRPRVTA